MLARALRLTFVSCVAAEALRNLQISLPPDVRGLSLLCSVELIDHTFANSYGKPAKAFYKPATACGDPIEWSRLVLNFTATSQGRQYDRLSTFWLNHVQVLQTSTAEPTVDGIVWTVLKDVSHYHSLFSESGPLLLDLGNLLDPSANLTGSYNVTLSLHIYGGGKTLQRNISIMPLSTRSTEQANYFDSTGSIKVLAPFNAVEAYVELYAAAQYMEEFHYANVPDEAVRHLPDGAGIIAKGPFREVQLWIDDTLSGFISPLPVIYTGGILATAWRPVAAYGAFDAPSYVADISPFLPLLCDDTWHTISLRTIGQDAKGSINPNWLVSGNVRFVTGTSQERTRGRVILHEVTERPVMATIVSVDLHGNVSTRVTTERSMRTVAELLIGTDKRRVAVQSTTTFTNHQRYRKEAMEQEVWQTILTESRSVHDGEMRLRDKADFLLSVSTNWNTTALRLDATIDQTFSRDQHLPQSAFAGHSPRTIMSHQSADGFLQLDGSTGRIINGSAQLSQFFSANLLERHRWQKGPSYWHAIEAAGGRIIRDAKGGPLARQRGLLTEKALSNESAGTSEVMPPRWLRRFHAVH